MVPKVEVPEQVTWVSEQHRIRMSCPTDCRVGAIRMLIGVETAKGILNLQGDRRRGPTSRGHHLRRRGLCRQHRRHAHQGRGRGAVCAPGGGHGLRGLSTLQAIDIVSIDFKDIEALRLEAEHGARLGFSGKQIIHPAQVRAGAGRLHPLR